MEAVGWIMDNDDDDPVVIVVTDNGHLLIRDNSFAHGRSWLSWESEDTGGREHGSRMNEKGNYRLAVEPLQCSIPDSFVGNPQSQSEEDSVEETMAPLLAALTAALGADLPKLVSAYGLSIGAGTPHVYNDGIHRPAPVVAIVGKILGREVEATYGTGKDRQAAGGIVAVRG